jgi:hypothetical protein
MHGKTFGIAGFLPGDDIEFIHPGTMLPYAANRVESVERLDAKQMILTLAEPLPEGIKLNSDALENVTWTPAVEIRDCYVERIPTRGFLITTRRKVVIRNNHFFKTSMHALLMENDASGWYESGPVHDLTIIGNTFTGCKEPVIEFNPRNKEYAGAVHKNIRILNNTAYLRKTLAGGHSTDNIVISGNKLISTAGTDREQAFKFRNCNNITIENNEYIKE